MTKKKQGGYERLPKGYGRQVGSSLSHQTAASIYGFLGHPEYRRLIEYERAMTTDDTVGTGIEFIKLSVLASLGPYYHPDETIREFVNANLNQMKGNFKMALGELITSGLWAGFGVSETIYKPKDGNIWIDYIANYNPKNIFLQVNAKGQLTEGESALFNSAYETGIWQDQIGGSAIRLPMSRCCLITHNRRYNNYYGESAIKRVYKNWRLKDAALEMWATALDRYGTPIVYSIVPAAYTGRTIKDPQAPGGERQETIADTMESSISNVGNGTGVVVQRPSPQDDIELGTLTTGNNFGSAFREKLSYLNTAIYRGLLIPQLLIAEQEGGGMGGQAIAAVHFEVFKLMLGELYNEMIEPFVEQVIGPLIQLNFATDDFGYFERAVYDVATLEVMSNVFTSLVESGLVDNQDLEDINMLRSKAGLPMMDSKRGKRLIDRNHAKSLTADHAGSQVITTQGTSTTKNTNSGSQGGPSAPTQGGSGGGSGKPSGSGGKTSTQGSARTTQQQIVKAPLPRPPKPVVDTGEQVKAIISRSKPNRISKKKS